MKNFFKPLLLMGLLGLALTLFPGCRTAHGFGEDMERTGQKIQDGAQ